MIPDCYPRLAKLTSHHIVLCLGRTRSPPLNDLSAQIMLLSRIDTLLAHATVYSLTLSLLF